MFVLLAISQLHVSYHLRKCSAKLLKRQFILTTQSINIKFYKYNSRSHSDLSTNKKFARYFFDSTITSCSGTVLIRTK